MKARATQLGQPLGFTEAQQDRPVHSHATRALAGTCLVI